MIIGIPKEIKPDEYRVGIVPSGVQALTAAGHPVLVERSAGLGSGVTDGEMAAVGARIVDTAEEVFGEAEMIIKVKEPLAQEWPLLREGQILYTYLHLAPARELTEALLQRGVIGIAYETIQEDSGHLPLLTPMSEVAGRMAIQAGARSLEKEWGGRGVLLSGVPGVSPGTIVVIGAGVVGSNATKIAVGMGAEVIVFDLNLDRLRYLDDVWGSRIQTRYSSALNIRHALERADLVIGAVLIPGATAPKLIQRDMLTKMPEGSVLVDVAVDQGGCAETTRPTTHSDPTFVVDGVIHYCVANMPGAVARTSTFALCNATMPYALKIAGAGLSGALSASVPLQKGVNVYRGSVTHPAVADSLGLDYTPLASVTDL